jgi:hypothetical protein
MLRHCHPASPQNVLCIMPLNIIHLIPLTKIWSLHVLARNGSIRKNRPYFPHIHRQNLRNVSSVFCLEHLCFSFLSVIFMYNVDLSTFQVWFMGEHSHISAELDNVSAVFFISYYGHLIKYKSIS